MRALVVVAAAVGATLATAPGAAQQNFDTVQVRSTHVAGGVWMLQGAGGNIGVAVGADGTFLVDDQFAPGGTPTCCTPGTRTSTGGIRSSTSRAAAR